MKLSNQIPEIYSKCHEVFGVNWSKGVVITYEDTVYCKFDISPDLIVHEGTHIQQQLKYGVKEWWERYFVDVEFRLSQEKEAYQNQAKWIKKNVKNREIKFKLLKHIIDDFSGSMYGNMITREDATKLLL